MRAFSRTIAVWQRDTCAQQGASMYDGARTLSLARGTIASPRICCAAPDFGGTPDEIARLAAMSARCGRVVDSLCRYIHTAAAAQRKRVSGLSRHCNDAQGLDEAAKREAARVRRKDAVGNIVTLQDVVAQPHAHHARAAAREDDVRSARALHDRRDRKGRLAEPGARAESALSQYALGNLRELTLAVSKIRRC